MIYLTHFCLLFQFEPHETFAYASYGSAKTQTATKMHQKKKAENTELLQRDTNNCRDVKQPQRCKTTRYTKWPQEGTNYKETQQVNKIPKTKTKTLKTTKNTKIQTTKRYKKESQTTTKIRQAQLEAIL